MANQFVGLNVTAGNGTGIAANVATMAVDKTVIVEGSFDGQLYIDGSIDGLGWAPLAVFTGPGMFDAQFPATIQFSRVRRTNALSPAPLVAIAADTLASAEGISAPREAFVYQPNGTRLENVYPTLLEATSVMATVQGPKQLWVDDSVLSPAPFPAGNFQMENVALGGRGPRDGSNRAVADIAEGCRLLNFRQLSGQLLLRNFATATPVVSDFGAGATDTLFQFGLRDAPGFPQLQNLGAAPFFDITSAISVIFGAHLCELNMVALATPFIRLVAGATAVLNLGVETQLGRAPVSGPVGSTYILSPTLGFWAFDQGQGVEFLGTFDLRTGQNRYPRRVFPIPPAAPAVVSTGLRTGDVYRVNGTVAFAHVLPVIRGSFVSQGQILSTMGNEILAKEQSGGALATFVPGVGNTIDGGPGPVVLPAGGVLRFTSDYETNYILG